MKRNLYLILLIIFAIPTLVSGQRWKYQRYELSVGAGVANFLGELGGANKVGTHYFEDYEFNEHRLALSIGLRYKLSNYFALKSHFTYGRVAGDDKLTDDKFRHYRNLNFFSDIYEFNVNFEAAFQQEQVGHRYHYKRVKGLKYYEIYMYAFAGVGVFYFDPKTVRDNGEVAKLQPVSTEGQGVIPSRSNYSLVQPCIPMGIGFKYTIDRKWGVGLELGVRKTFTDYIDDVSKTYWDVDAYKSDLKDYNLTKELSDRSDKAYGLANGIGDGTTAPGAERGDPRYKDAYMFAIFTVNYKMRNDKRNLPMF